MGNVRLTKEERLERIKRYVATLRGHIQKCDPATQQDIIKRLQRQCLTQERAIARIEKTVALRAKGLLNEHGALKTRQELCLEQIRHEHGEHVRVEYVVETSEPKSVWTTGQAGGPGTGKRR